MKETQQQQTLKFCNYCKKFLPADSEHFYLTGSKAKTLKNICKKCHNKKRREWREKNENARNKEKNCKLLRNYGITLEQYNEMNSRQGGKCTICGREPNTSLHCDHDHNTGNVRELLCNNCNLILGQAIDNVDILEKCITYLKKHGK